MIAGPDETDEEHVIELLADELTLARAQMDAAQPALAEGTLRDRIAYREAQGPAVDDELDALHALLAESLWRQGRLVSARAALDAVPVSYTHLTLPTICSV